MVIARKIAYNVVFNATTKILSTILALIAIGFITRYLGKEGFGDYATVLAFFSFFGSIADLGLYAIMAREISRENADEEKIVGNVFALRIFSALLVFVLAPVLAFFLPYSHNVKVGIIIAAASFVFSSTYMVLNGVFQKNLAMDRVGLAEVLGKVIQLSIIIFAVKQNLGFTAIIMSVLVAMLFNFITILFLVRKFIKIKLRFDFAYWKHFLKESLPMGISVIVTFLYFKMDTIMLSFLKTSADVGIYSAAYKVIENITFFPAMIVGLVLPLMSRHIFSDKERFAHIANETAKIFFLLVVPLIIGTLFLAENIIGLIGGAGFIESANTLRILIFALAFIFYGNLFNNILIAGNLQKKLMYALSVCAVFNISLNALFIPRLSYTGAALTSVFTEFLVVVLTFYLTRKYLAYTPKINNVLQILLSGLAMAIFLYFFKNQAFPVLFFGGSLTYVLFLWFTKTVTPKEILSIINPRGINQ